MTRARRIQAAVVAVCVLTSGCANHIRYADAVIWDRMPDTDRVSLDDQRVEGAVVRSKVRFTCQKQQYAVTNDYYTPYVGKAEWHEVPVGLVALVPSLAWWLVSEIVSLGSAPRDSAAGPLDWSLAGFNPFLNVENGMFRERYEIGEKEGSRRPQSASQPEPYDAVVPPAGGKVKAGFQGGPAVEVDVGKEVLLTLNLVEIAQVMPRPDSQKIIVEMPLKWSPQVDPVIKKVNVFIDRKLAARLYAVKAASKTLMSTQDRMEFDRALAQVRQAGFSREAAMIEDRRGRDFKG